MDGSRADILRVMIAINRVTSIYGTAAKADGINGSTLELLYALDDGLPHTQKQICEEWFIPRTTLNTAVKECVERGYVSLSGVEHSKEKIIVVTGSGKEYARRMLGDFYAAEQRAIERTRAEFTGSFVAGLERFADCLQSEFETGIFRVSPAKK